MRSDVSRAAWAGSTAWWLNAVLAHTESLDDGLAHLTGDTLGLGRDQHRQPWSLSLGALRSRGVARLRLAIVEPGDPVGIPGPAPVTAAAVGAGVALVADTAAITLVPDPVADVWRVLPCTPAATNGALGTLAECRALLREAMQTLTDTVPSMDPDPAALAALAEYRRFAGPLPPRGVSLRAREVATDALRVWWLTGIAHDLCRRQEHPVPETLRHLRPTARRAAAVAFSEPPNAG